MPQVDPAKRLSITNALRHPWLQPHTHSTSTPTAADKQRARARVSNLRRSTRSDAAAAAAAAAAVIGNDDDDDLWNNDDDINTPWSRASADPIDALLDDFAADAIPAPPPRQASDKIDVLLDDFGVENGTWPFSGDKVARDEAGGKAPARVIQSAQDTDDSPKQKQQNRAAAGMAICEGGSVIAGGRNATATVGAETPRDSGDRSVGAAVIRVTRSGAGRAIQPVGVTTTREVKCPARSLSAAGARGASSTTAGLEERTAAGVVTPCSPRRRKSRRRRRSSLNQFGYFVSGKIRSFRKGLTK